MLLVLIWSTMMVVQQSWKLPFFALESADCSVKKDEGGFVLVQEKLGGKSTGSTLDLMPVTSGIGRAKDRGEVRRSRVAARYCMLSAVIVVGGGACYSKSSKDNNK